MHKRGIGAVFAWIFVMIAGAMIIALFFTIANSQADAAEQRLQDNALRQVNTILTTQSTSFDTATTTPIPESDIRLRCRMFVQEGQLVPLAQLDIGGATRPLESELVAGQDLETDELLLFSKKWSAPYTIGNILMVGSEEELLVLVNNSALETNFNDLTQMFPPEVPTTTFEPSSGQEGYNPRNYQNLRVVKIGEAGSAPTANNYGELPTAVNQEDGLYMYIEIANNDIRESGSLYYYKINENADNKRAGPYRYVGEGMLAGLIWQADPIRASCLQHKLIQSLERQTQLQITRMQNLADRYQDQGNSVCASKLSTVRLEALTDREPRSEYNPPSDPRLYEFDLAQAVADVKEQNQNILYGGETCATIY